MADDSETFDPDGLNDRDVAPGVDSFGELEHRDVAPGHGSFDELDGVADPIAEDEVARIVAEEEEAARRLSAIEAGRRKGGVAGAAMAGAMLAISDIVEGPKRDEAVAVAEAPSRPDDIDLDGITVDLDGQEFWAPPPDGGAGDVGR